MAYGLRIKNDSLEIQIDGSNLNYSFSGQEGSDTTRAGYAYLVTVNFINPTAYPPIVLIRPTSGTDRLCGVFEFTYSGGYYTAVKFFGGQFPGPAAGYCDFDYKIYMANPPSSGEAYGLRVKDASGLVVFESGRSPFKILEVVNSLAVGTVYTHSAYSDPYYIFSPWLSGLLEFCSPPQQGPVVRLMMGISRQSSTSMKGAWMWYQQIGITNFNNITYQDTVFNLIVCAP